MDQSPEFGPARGANPWPALALVGGVLAALLVVALGLPSLGNAPAGAELNAQATETPSVSGPPPAEPIKAADITWTPSVCTWADEYLKEDVQLDRANAAKIQANGPDPRWPAETAAGSLVYAEHWDAVDGLVSRQCSVSTNAAAGATVPDCGTAITWLADAARGHDADLRRPGATAYEASWNKAWAAFYRSLIGDLQQSCVL